MKMSLGVMAAQRRVIAHRQQVAPITFVNGYVFPSGAYPASNLAYADGQYCISNNCSVGSGQHLIATYDFGSPKYLQDCRLQGVIGLDWNQSGAAVGVHVQIADDTGYVLDTVMLGGQSTGVIGINRSSRYLRLYAGQIGGYGSDPFGNYDTEAYFDCLDVTGAL